MMIGLDEARQIAEQYLIGLSVDAGVKLELPSSQTLERDFGWVFYYGPEDTSLTLAGNAPFIVDRKDGSIHVTGTAYPTEVYLENYDLTGTAFPPGVPEHTVSFGRLEAGQVTVPQDIFDEGHSGCHRKGPG